MLRMLARAVYVQHIAKRDLVGVVAGEGRSQLGGDLGFDPEAGRTGRGVDHMRRRAERIGARLGIESDGKGTRIRVEMPAPEGGNG